ncbi:MAG TPA: hypothetical protein VNN17_09515, partial [Terriglobia bacterium]|nr:hypothetical protein [Terriglobia bacterium]
TEVNQLTRMMYRADKNNFAPRFGFAWNPGRGQTVVRGGYGISYAAILPVSYGMARFNPPQVQVYLVQAPDLLHPLAGSTARPSSQFLLSPDLIPAYSHQYTLAIERALPGAMSLRAAYLGSRTFHLLTQQVYNRARPSAVLPNTTATVQARRPNPNLADINVIESNANAYYDALQLTLDKRISRGLAFRAVYTFGKNIDTGGDFTNTATGVERPPETGITTCEECDRISDHKGVSLFDTPHALVFSYSYLIPFRTASRWANTVLSGWQVSGTTIFQSGIPYHLHTGSDGPGLGNVDGVSQDRPNITNSRLLGSSFDDPDTSVQRLGADTCRLLSPGEVPAGVAPYIRCSSFDSNLPLGGRGNLGWNTFRKDGTHNWNVSLGKTFSLPGGRERTVQFRAEFINFFNHAIFDKPNVQMSSPIFGQITNTANKGRQIQFSLRLNL